MCFEVQPTFTMNHLQNAVLHVTMEETSTNSPSSLSSQHTNDPFCNETIRSLVQAYLDELRSVKLDTIDLWSVENTVHAIVSHSSTEIRNLSFKMLIEKGNEKSGTPLDKDDDYFATITEIGVRNITRILEDLVNEFSPINDNDEISDEEYRNALRTVIQDTVESASEIVKVIMERVPSRTTALDRTSWIKVTRRTSVFFFCRFTKEVVLCLVAKLKQQFVFCSPVDSDASIVVLLDKVDWLVEKLLPKMEDQQTAGTAECYFSQIAKEIKEEELSIVTKQLAYSLVLCLKPGPNFGLSFRRQVQGEVDALIDELLRWLHQQAEQHETKTDLTSAAMIKIEKVAENLLALINGLLGKENDTSSIHTQPALDEDFDENDSISNSQEFTFQACQFMVVKLVNTFINPCAIHIYWYKVNSVVVALTERLFAEIGDCEIVDEFDESNANAFFKEMKKDLSGDGNCSCWVQMALLCQDPCFLEYALDTLKKHLVSPLKKFCLIGFLKRLYRRPPDTPLLVQSQDRALSWRKLDIPHLGKLDSDPEGATTLQNQYEDQKTNM